MGVDWNDVSANSNGGTELMLRRLEKVISPELLDKVQIIPSRVRELDSSRYRILYLHDLPGDPGADGALANGGWDKFHRLVFVSHWQARGYQERYGIPPSRCVVIRNSIDSIPASEKPDGPPRLIYFSTPHRGLDILLSVFPKIRENHPGVELDVFSSFKLYGWKERDAQFKPLYDLARSIDGVNYSESVSNDEIRSHLQKCHVLAYPCTWPETSCLTLIESMSAGLICVHPNLAALPETAGPFTMMYDFHEDKEKHASRFYGELDGLIRELEAGSTWLSLSRDVAKRYVDTYHSMSYFWESWTRLINELIEHEPIAPPSRDFVINIR